jgi:hypothetical protein
MEKKAALSALLMLALLPAALPGAPAAPAAITATAAAGVTTAASVTGTASDEEDNLMEVRLQELHFNITPEFQFVLPDASLRIGLKQKLGDTRLDASTEYNYLYNKFRYDIRYSVELYMTFSANLYDAVNFEQLYQSQKHIQRNKGFGISVQTPEFFDFLRLREEFVFDNYYFARLDNSFSPETGAIMLLYSWLELDLSFSEKEINGGDRLAVNFDKSMPSDASSYNFLFLNVLLQKGFDFGSGQALELKFEGGYLLEKNDVPIWQIYRLGGYDRMIGFNYDEFEGYYMDFLRLKYSLRAFSGLNWELPLITVDNIDMFFIVDMGSAGTDHDVTCIEHYNYSTGLGAVVEFTFRKRTKVRMTFAVAQAVSQGKYPVFYFAHEF